MVQRQLADRGITHPGVLGAMTDVPRHWFVPAAAQRQAYDDCPLSIGSGQTISQPYIVAYMLAALDPRSGQQVLDVGLGSGYQAALLAKIVAHVYAMDRLDELTRSATGLLDAMGLDNVTAVTADGSLGWAEHAPYDRIICGAAAPETPQPWIDQLADGGRIVAPVGGRGVQTIEVIDRAGGQITRKRLVDVRFVPLLGQYGQDR